MTLSEVWNKCVAYEDLRNGGFKPSVWLVSKDHIFNEDKSVKWNREEAERVNNQYQQERNDFHKRKAEAYSAAESATMEYIMQELSVSREKAKKIYNFCDDFKYDDSLRAMFELIDNLIDALR